MSGASERNGRDGGDAILQACRDLGVDYIISSPGSDWGSIWEALTRQQQEGAAGPKYLNCGHELLAVDVAIGYTALTGRMQTVLLHAGVGLMQGSMGIYGARLTETPMLLMSGESTSFGDQPGFDPGPQWYHNHNIVGGLHAIVAPLVKWAHQAGSAANLYEMVRRAGKLALAAPAGPTYLDVPIELMLQPWTPPLGPRPIAAQPRLLPSPEDVESVVTRLLAAKHPLIVTASVGRTARGYAALVDLAETLSIPVVESPSGEVDSFPRDHPLHRGFDVPALLRHADLVLAVKSRTPWYPPRQASLEAPVIVIDEQPFKSYMAYQNLCADALLGGDVASTLRLLADGARARIAEDANLASTLRDRRARCAEAHDALQAQYRAAETKARAATGIHAIALCAALAEAMPADAMYVDETTMHLPINRRHLVHRGPQCYLAIRSGLGQGLGVALGAKLACPERTVVSLIGDGALLYNPTLPALGFARDERLPLLIVIYNNQGYRAMRDSQLGYYPQGLGAQRRQFQGEAINGFDYEALAASFGGVGIRVDTLAALGQALQQGLATVKAGKTAIINVLLAD